MFPSSVLFTAAHETPILLSYLFLQKRSAQSFVKIALVYEQSVMYFIFLYEFNFNKCYFVFFFFVNLIFKDKLTTL